jgi:hypothetical protein
MTTKLNNNVPTIVPNATRIILNLDYAESRMDTVLLTALKNQSEHMDLKHISRGALKVLFTSGKILIKGQKARPSSALAKGTTYVDILLK